VPIPDLLASSLHAEILVTPEGHKLRALASSSRTRLNGQSFDEAVLQFGDVIAIGDTRLLFETDAFQISEAELNSRNTGPASAAGERAPLVPGDAGEVAPRPVTDGPSAPLDRLSGAVAEQLQEPLQDLVAGCELLMEDLGFDAASAQPDSTRKTLELLSRLAGRCLEFVGNLWHHAHCDDSVEKQWISLHELLEDATARLRGPLTAKGVTLRLQSPERLPRVAGNAPQLEQVFVNLLRNALEASASGDSIHAYLTQELGRLEVRIVDAGEGIAPDALPLVFRETYTTRAGSAGLGLTVSKKLVERHGGTIDVESAVGKGTSVLVKFPAAQAGLALDES
jgi:signal transduction histidine kinase